MVRIAAKENRRVCNWIKVTLSSAQGAVGSGRAVESGGGPRRYCFFSARLGWPKERFSVRECRGSREILKRSYYKQSN